MKFILGVICSYLLGSIPTAFIYGKISKGIDIRQHGSGNVGATNVFRVLGKGPGILVLILDILKGAAAVTVIPRLLGIEGTIPKVILALVVVSGHNWTIFLRFKGGKGIAASLGALIGLAVEITLLRPILLWTVLVWLICFLLTGFVSLSSVIASVCLPLIMVWMNQPIELICLGVFFCIFVVIRHRPNIRRLFSGQEPRVPLFFKKRT